MEPQKKGCSGKKNISLSIFEAVCSGLEKTVLAVETYNIAVMALCIRLSVTVQTDSWSMKLADFVKISHHPCGQQNGRVNRQTTVIFWAGLSATHQKKYFPFYF